MNANNPFELPTADDVCPGCGKAQQPDEWVWADYEGRWLCIACEGWYKD
jgi:hypothetical protein